MKYLHLVLANLGRKKFRTAFTVLSIFVAFLLFGLLMAIKAAFGVGVELAGIDRLIMIHRVSLIQPLPISYKNRILADEGVEAVTHANWFGGIYQEPKNFFAQYAVAENYLDLYPENLLPEEHKEAWLENRTGAIVGRITADRFGWKVGDRIPIQGTIFRTQDGGPWEFTIEGIFDGADETTDLTPFIFHYKYLLEGAAGMSDIVGWYIIRVADPESSGEIAERIDQQFANSPAETRTTTEKAFIQSFANQTGNISAIVTGIAAVVFFTLMLVTGNTMAQSVRERTNELAVLKTLGFTGDLVMLLVMAESLLLALLGGGTGLLLITWVTHAFRLGGSLLPNLHVPWDAAGVGAVLVVGMGLTAGALPAFSALRLRIADALGRRA
jgi:putative ABC transport system permease protein